MSLIDLARAKGYTNEQLNKNNNNNQPTQTLTFDGGIYSVPSNIVNGQISDIRLLGNTRTNLFKKLDTMPANVTYNPTTDEYVCSVGGTGNIITPNINIKPNTAYLISFDIKCSEVYTPANKAECFRVDDIASGTWIDGLFSQIGTSYARLTFSIPSTNTATGLRFVLRNAVNKSLTIKNIMLEEGTELKPYITTGTKSTVSNIRLVSFKNLFNRFQNLIIGYYLSSTGNISASPSGENQFVSDYIKVDSSTAYIISNTAAEENYIRIGYYDTNKNFIKRDITGTKATEFTFTTPSTAQYIRVSQEVGTEKTTLLEKGTVKTELKESMVYISAGGELRSVGIAKDEVNATSGEKVQRVSDDKLLTQISSYLDGTVARRNIIDTTGLALPADNSTLPQTTRLIDKNTGSALDRTDSVNWDTTGGIGKYYISSTGVLYIISAVGVSPAINHALTYQLMQNTVTKIPQQPPLQVFEGGSIYVEPVGDLAETTLPTVEITAPIGQSNNFGVATHDYQVAAADWVLSGSEAKSTLLIATNAGGTANIIAPDRPGLFYVVNNISGQTMTIKKSGGTGVAIATGKTALVMHNGTNFIKITGEV
ncbi:hypothetical protein Dred_2595 [Desulforamulus reducens MI-1]|uniref:Uncharacterized protein n=1 Tax=Desulforamulus reducens (strain ATCC BAA-1160 / DSM 100696 / MI-1) TaxID=349161 RepID=A4J7Q2_DESRM|nr:hypothetical protein [Desulforamulus reducens]ABO51105.1 hypothetical protein Dred_2595 [Desulforamulus reducens MI-1]